jgi:hypothetical protein
MKGNDRDMFEGLSKSMKTPVRIAGMWAGIGNWCLGNSKQGCLSLDRDVRWQLLGWCLEAGHNNFLLDRSIHHLQSRYRTRRSDGDALDL